MRLTSTHTSSDPVPRAAGRAPRHGRVRHAALLAAVVLLASACTSSGDSESASDPQRHHDTYDEQPRDTGSGSVPQPAPPSADAGRAQPDLEAPAQPAPNEDNTFVDPGTSGFVQTREKPRSTFAVDVDTGSYRVARSLLADGYLPPPESVRPEEWINAFGTGFPAPTKDDLELRTDQASATKGSDGTRLVRIGLQGREVDEEHARPVALTMVVDTSGSMDIRDRLGLVKSSLALLVQHLRPTDTISIVTYETRATPLLEPTPVRQSDVILDAIDRLRAGGSTNLEAGLMLGYDQAQEAYRPGATNVVVLASDGVANVGVDDGSQLASAIRDQGRRGIHLVTVGYGMGNYNDDLMEQLADRGNGFYAYVDTFEEARRLFVDDLRATLTPVAKDAKIQVEFDPRTVSAYRLIGYENRALAEEDFDDASVDAGEVGAGHKVSALYEVRPTGQATRGDVLATATVRWRSVDTEEQRQGSVVVTLGRSGQPRGSLGVAVAAADLAQLVKGSERALGLADLQGRISALVSQQAPGANELRTAAADLAAISSGPEGGSGE